MNIKIEAAAMFSIQGDRPLQEDNVLIDKSKGVFIVADGFGGPKSGQEASKLACDSVKRYLFKKAGDQDATMPFILRQYFSLAGNVLFNAVMFANQQIRKLNKAKNVNECGASSILAALVDEELLAIASVGCCDAWLFRDGNLVELIKPRTFGHLRDPFSNNSEKNQFLQVPLMALGMAEDLEPEIFEFRLKKGDFVLLNTDGLTQEALNEIHYLIAQVQKSGPSVNDPSASASILTQAGSIIEKMRAHDNCAITLIKF